MQKTVVQTVLNQISTEKLFELMVLIDVFFLNVNFLIESIPISGTTNLITLTT